MLVNTVLAEVVKTSRAASVCSMALVSSLSGENAVVVVGGNNDPTDWRSVGCDDISCSPCCCGGNCRRCKVSSVKSGCIMVVATIAVRFSHQVESVKIDVVVWGMKVTVTFLWRLIAFTTATCS